MPIFKRCIFKKIFYIEEFLTESQCSDTQTPVSNTRPVLVVKDGKGPCKASTKGQ